MERVFMAANIIRAGAARYAAVPAAGRAAGAAQAGAKRLPKSRPRPKAACLTNNVKNKKRALSFESP